MSMRNSLKVRSSVLIGIFTALLALCAYIHVPYPPISFTLQTFGIYLCLFCLGTKKCVVCLSVYTLMGIIGVPVFSGFQGGIGALLGATGGFILGFIPTVLLASLFIKLFGKTSTRFYLCALLSLPLCYAIGCVWFVAVYLGDISVKNFIYAFTVCVLPYVLPDAVKLLLASLLGARVEKILKLKDRA